MYYIGTVKGIAYDPGLRAPVLPHAIMVELFDDYLGPFLTERLLSFTPISKYWKEINFHAHKFSCL